MPKISRITYFLHGIRRQFYDTRNLMLSKQCPIADQVCQKNFTRLTGYGIKSMCPVSDIQN